MAAASDEHEGSSKERDFLCKSMAGASAEPEGSSKEKAQGPQRDLLCKAKTAAPDEPQGSNEERAKSQERDFCCKIMAGASAEREGSSTVEEGRAKNPEGDLLCKSIATSAEGNGPGEGSINVCVGQPPKKPRFELKKWSGVAFWSWDLENDTCAICRGHIMELCIECQAQMTSSTSEQCVVAWGSCNHAFHLHCISNWLKTRKVCPLDNSEGDFAKYGN